MRVTIRSVLELFDGENGEPVTNIEDLDQPIAEIVRLEELTVRASITHATLVSCSRAQIDHLIHAEHGDKHALIKECVLIADTLEPKARQLLEDRGYSYILGQLVVEQEVTAMVRTLITESFAYEDRLVASAMRALTLIAGTGGMQGVLSELSRLVDGWAVLLDSHGQVINSVGAGRLHIDDAVSVVLNRPVRIRYPGLQLHVVGSSDEQTARLVLASRLESAYRARTIAAHAAALLALMLRTTSQSDVERNGRELMLDTLIRHSDRAGQLLNRWKITESRLSAFVMSSRTRNIDVERLASLWLRRTGAPPLYVADAGETYGFAPKAALQRFALFAGEFRTGQGQRVSLGLGEEMPVEQLGRALGQARRAHDAAVRTKEPVLWFDDLLSVRKGLFELTDEQRTALESLLDPLTLSEDHSEGLVRTLRVFLTHHGSWSPTAKELRVHRQTVLNRIQRLEALLGLSLDSADNRALLWLSLRQRERAGGGAAELVV